MVIYGILYDGLYMAITNANKAVLDEIWIKYDFNIEPNKQQHCFPSSHTCKSYSIYLYKDVHVYIQYVSEILESFSD